MFKTNYSTIKCSNCKKISKVRRLGGTMFGAILGGITPVLSVIMGKIFDIPIALLGVFIIFIIQMVVIYFYDNKYFEIMYD